MNKLLICMLAMFPLFGSACVGAGASQKIEEMSETDFNKFALYVELGTKIGFSRLIDENVVSVSEATLLADGLDTLAKGPVTVVGESVIRDFLEKNGIQRFSFID